MTATATKPKTSAKAAKGDAEEWPEYTWQEIADHNTKDSMWMYYEREVFDVTDWIYKHPGGHRFMFMYAGRDISPNLPSHHPLEFDKVLKHLRTMKIGVLKGPSEFPAFKPFGSHPFDKAWHAEYRNLFKIQGWETSVAKGGGMMKRYSSYWWLTTVWWFVCAIMLWVIALTLDCGPLMRSFLSVVAGIANLNTLVNSMHNVHHSGQDFDGMWSFARFFCDWWLAINPQAAIFEHTVGHHTYTNVIGHDTNGPDMAGGKDFVRVTDRQKYFDKHWWQFIYYPLASLMIPFDAMMGYYQVFSTGWRYNIRVPPFFRGMDELVFDVFGIAFHITRSFIIPKVYFGVPLYISFWVWLFSNFGIGGWAGCTFVANHFFESALWPEMTKDENGYDIVDASWAEAQVRVSLGYGGWFHFWMTAGLNIHLPHHICPCSPMELNPYLLPVVRYLCKKHNLPYYYDDHLFQSLASYQRLLKKYGWPPLEKPTLL